jgi:D-hexose-6-phosphate mutarotase
MAIEKSDSKAGKESLGRVAFLDGRGELPMLEVSTPWSTAEIYLHGAQVTHFQKRDEPPMLFLSQCSRFAQNEAIRGGIPVILPWFGPREGMAAHGFARVKAWDLKEVVHAPDGSVSVRLKLPEYPEASAFPAFDAEYVVTVSRSLNLKLIVTSRSADESLIFENCLHTYFAVGDIKEVEVLGLKGVSYLDKVANFARKTESNEAIRIASEVDRIYLNTSGTVEILDRKLGRKIRVEKQGSNSTVVWNPWIVKAQQMPDFGNEEYERMVCVESGNVAANRIALPPGVVCTLSVSLSTSPLT